MPLVGSWTIVWMTEEGEKGIVWILDSINIPIGVYRGFRYDGEERGHF